jgi:hypothetical protein
MIGIASHQRRQIECDAQSRTAGLQQLPVAPVRFFGRAEPGELAHRPELAAIAVG